MTAQPDLEPAGPAPARKASTRRRVIKWVRIALGVLCLAFVALVVSAIIGLKGGIPWAFTTAPTKTDKEVVAANAAGDVQQGRLASDLQAAGAAAGLVRVATSTQPAYCDEGQHNWKIHNNYDLKCSTRASLVLGSSSPSVAAAKTQLLALNDQMIAQRWQSSGRTVEMMAKFKTGPSPRPIPGLHRPFGQAIWIATYVQGTEGQVGSTRIEVAVAGDEDDTSLQKLDPSAFGQRLPDNGSNPLGDTKRYLQGGLDRYILIMDVSYTTFSK